MCVCPCARAFLSDSQTTNRCANDVNKVRDRQDDTVRRPTAWSAQETRTDTAGVHGTIGGPSPPRPSSSENDKA